jgi:hypothetical protein
MFIVPLILGCRPLPLPQPYMQVTLDLIVTTITMGFAYTTTVSGFFGMNCEWGSGGWEACRAGVRVLSVLVGFCECGWSEVLLRVHRRVCCNRLR